MRRSILAGSAGDVAGAIPTWLAYQTAAEALFRDSLGQRARAQTCWRYAKRAGVR